MSGTPSHRPFLTVPPPSTWSPTDIARTFRSDAHRLGIPLDNTPLGPVWVAPETAAAVKRVVRLLPLLQRALRSVGTGRAVWTTALRTDPRLYPVAEDEAEDPRLALMFARPDVVVSSSGPKVLEFNTGSGSGGYTEQQVMHETWRKIYGGAAARDPDLLRHWALALSRATTRNGGKPTQLCVLVSRQDYPDEVLDFEAYFGVQARHMNELGIEYFVCEPEELDSQLADRSPDTCIGLRHFQAFEWRLHDIDVAPLQRAINRGFKFYYPQEAAMVANKRLLAWLSSKACHLSPEESRLVDELVPWTRELVAGSRGAEDLYTYALEHREHLVLKRCMSLSARDVVVGCLVTRGRWRAAVNEAYVAGDSIVQEFVEHESAEVYLDVDGQPVARQVHPVLSPFFVDGEYAGCTARYIPDGSVKPSSVDTHGAVLNTAVFTDQAVPRPDAAVLGALSGHLKERHG
jgi:hypothetical protein